MFKAAMQSYLRYRRAQLQRPPRLRSSSRPAPQRKIYFLCPDHRPPAGGIRTIYRLVDLLNDGGHSAAVLHSRPGFSVTWFDHSTTIVYAREVVVNRRDILVVPEIYGPFLHELPREPALIVFNQNAYLTFSGSSPGRELYRDVSALLTVSQDNAEYLRFAFPQIPVDIIRPSIPAEIFSRSEGIPQRRIAYMPRRRREDVDQVFGILGSRLNGWEPVPLDGLSQRATANSLRECPLFMALSQREGFGLPPAEAMAAGCYVVGFTGLAGREYFLPEFCRPVEEDNVRDLAMALAEEMLRYEREPERVRTDGARASQYIHSNYSEQRERSDLLRFFSGLP